MHEAAFIQRKGRAGRSTRCGRGQSWCLSDYGRDRARYQAFESLFAPVSARYLPVDNQHVIKQQAAFALLDWLHFASQDSGPGVISPRRRTSDGTPSGAAGEGCAGVLREVLRRPPSGT